MLTIAIAISRSLVILKPCLAAIQVIQVCVILRIVLFPLVMTVVASQLFLIPNANNLRILLRLPLLLLLSLILNLRDIDSILRFLLFVDLIWRHSLRLVC